MTYLMIYRITTIFLLSALICTTGCKETNYEKDNDELFLSTTFEQEKAAILNIINGETKAAFRRDYAGWKGHWIHESYVTKTYIEFPDSSFSETLGWDDIDKFVRTYIEEHPEPDPTPTLVDRINVRIYGNGAWVNFEQNDSERGLKRETRLMEKADGQWKIAGMHTTIYGFKTSE